VQRRRLDTSAALILVVHALIFLILTRWSWRKWPDPVIDFGRELYVPWMINRGAVLYRDIASLFGPLSPYVNAFWFRLFGDSLLTLVVCNLAILAATTAGIYHLIRTSTDRVTATAAGLAMLLLFGFAQYGGLGNYNFITPYSHETTHGFALCVALLVSLHRSLTAESRAFGVLAGLCCGLALLTKPEISLGALAIVAAGFTGAWLVDESTRRTVMRIAPLVLASAALPPVLFFLYFAQHMAAPDALRAVAGAWAPAFVPGIADNNFYKLGMGLDRPWANTVRMFGVFAVFAIFFVVLAAACWTPTDPAARRRRLLQLAIGGVGIYLAQLGLFSRALPLVCLTALIVFSAMFLRARPDRPGALRLLPMLMWCTFGIVLLSKMILNARLNHYGFYLTIPAITAAIALLVGAIPPALARWSATATSGQTFRRLALFACAAAAIPYLAHSNAWYRSRVIEVGFGSDRFWASDVPRMFPAAAVQEALRELVKVRPDGRFAVLPEGVMMNFQVRRESPLRVATVMPPEILAFGEDDVVRSLEAKPPDLVVLLHRDVSEYGYPIFGTDARYGKRIMDWVNARYRVTRTIGVAPHDPSSPAIQIYERAGAGAAPLAR
jgi:Dolichyl-phosphate-mannose-protein mannosyltransferase